MDGQQPHRFGRYEVEDILGSGGIGVVYRGRDTTLARHVAIKTLRGHGPEQHDRFLREARHAALLSHPNVAAVFDIGLEGDTLFVVQELLEGEDLSQVLARHPQGLDPPVAVFILQQVALALQAAHEKGLVHRDVKPGNVMLLPSGVAKVLDFGIARLVDASDNLTQQGTMLGTPAYMAPEQLRGELVDPRADVYSFGVLAFELLSGSKPFAAENLHALFYQVVSEPAPSIAERVPDCPPALARIVQHCLEKQPSARPPAMELVVQVLERLTSRWDPAILAGEAPAASPSPQVVTGAAPVPFDATLPPPPASASPNYPTSPPQPSPFLPPPMPPPAPDATWIEPARDMSGQTVGRFTLHELVARGTSGDLYKAWDPVWGALVGVKVVRSPDPEVRHRLCRAGRIWLPLEHDNIVRVLEVHVDYGGQPGVIVMRLVDGANLAELMAERQLTVEEKVGLAVQLCDALQYIHEHGVIHREVRPRNVVVSRTTLHLTLLDSGIARHANPEVDAFTRTGIIVGDLTYAAPEHRLGHVDQRADIYSAAAVLYTLLSGHALGFTPGAQQEDPVFPDEVPPRLRQLVQRALSPDPAARFATAREFGDQLRSFAPDRRLAGSARQAVVTLHGIRTQARWQRAFAEVAGSAGLSARLDRWNFGYFSSLRFLLPSARLAKVRWFRQTYEQEFPALASAPAHAAGEHPSIVAHSFGTYILGNALLRYPYLRFNKVLLCGSILPRSFPWDRIIERGQVQAVRNEYGSEDVWTRLVSWFVAGTGQSGLAGFTAVHPRLDQERFDFAHSEYFERSHMENRWLPFFSAEISQRPAQDLPIPSADGDRSPWFLYALYAALATGLPLIAVTLWNWFH